MIFKHMRAILLLPFMATIVVPAVIIYMTDSMNIGCSLPRPYCLAPLLSGVLFICTGLGLMIATNILFAKIGKGTLAPWDPTRSFVARGPYRHVRNPMISGVFSILLGEAVMLGSFPVFAWFLVFLAANLIYIPLVEERGLEQRFGGEYRMYTSNVPRWIPRIGPWDATERKE